MALLRKLIKKVCYSGIFPKMFLRAVENTILLPAMFIPLNSLRIFFNRLRGVKIGKNVYIGVDALLGNHPFLLTVGNNVVISLGTRFLTHDISFTCVGGKDLAGEITIGDNTFLGEGVIVLPGVKIGKNVVIGAGSIVSSDIPDGHIALGNPARCIKKTEDGLKDLKKKYEQDRFFYTW